jgi:DNA-damage-inducible protein D
MGKTVLFRAFLRRNVVFNLIKIKNKEVKMAKLEAKEYESFEEFAIFQNAGYMGLYGGLTVADIHRKKGLDKNEKILDFMGSTELIANLFRISQTEEKLKIEQTSSAGEANEIHYKIAEKIRKAMIDMGTTLPEDLPTPEKSIQTVEREEIRKLRNSKTRADAR